MSQFLVLLLSVFSMVNPLAAIPVHVGLTAELPAQERKGLPGRRAFAAWVIMGVAYLAGESLLAFFSISIASLRVVGGILVFAMAWSMLQARMASRKHRPGETEDAAARPHPAVVPLATRLMGLILAARAAEFLAVGFTEIFPAWTLSGSARGLGLG